MKFQLFILMFLCSFMTNGQDIRLNSKVITTSGISQNFSTVYFSQWRLGEVHSLVFGENNVFEENETDWDVNSYPNPFTSDLNLHFQTAKEMQVEIRVIDINGKGVYYQKNWQVLKGQTIRLNLDYLVLGTYLISVRPDNEKLQKIFKVQKSK